MEGGVETDELPTPSTRRVSTPEVESHVAFFFIRYDFDGDELTRVSCEIHGEPGRLLWCPDDVENPPGDRREGPRLALYRDAGVGTLPGKSVLPAAHLPIPFLCHNAVPC